MHVSVLLFLLHILLRHLHHHQLDYVHLLFHESYSFFHAKSGHIFAMMYFLRLSRGHGLHITLHVFHVFLYLCEAFSSGSSDCKAACRT